MWSVKWDLNHLSLWDSKPFLPKKLKVIIYHIRIIKDTPVL